MSSTPFGDLIAKAAEAKYVIIPAGDYLVVVRDANATMSSTGKDMIKLAVKVIAGPHKDASILGQQTLSPENPAAVAMFIHRFLGSFGLSEEWLAELPPREDGGPNMSAVAAALKGRAAVCAVDVHEWNGEDRNGIDKFKKPNPEQEQAIREALEAAGGDASTALGAPSAGPADPFAAAAAPAGGTPESEAGF